MKRVEVHKNRYVDSVTLMSLSDQVMKLVGVRNAEAQMGTRANLAMLTTLSYTLPDEIGSDDLVLAVSADNEDQLQVAFQNMVDQLDRKMTDDSEIQYSSLDEIDLDEDHYDLVQISLPGADAVASARQALEMGLDVFLFSDNVPLEEEYQLKKLAIEKKRLFMGADCGVAWVHGICLGAGSIMQHGPLGIVAASGSGAQEIACLAEKLGVGVEQIIGTGGRDLYPQIGGLAMIDGMRRLDRDPAIRVIVLVSKLADSDIMQKVLAEADRLNKPTVAVFLGASPKLAAGRRVQIADTLEEAALTACRLLGRNAPSLLLSAEQIKHTVTRAIGQYGPKQRYLRALYCGGTFTEEALIHLAENCRQTVLYSNLKTAYARQLPDHRQSIGHSILDLGAEDFTAEAPHPVFDASLRMQRLRQELADPEVAVVVLDFITGPGVAADPFSDVINLIEMYKSQAEHPVAFIASICGSLQDPQNTVEQAKRLRRAGVIVAVCSSEGTRLAAAMLNALTERENS